MTNNTIRLNMTSASSLSSSMQPEIQTQTDVEPTTTTTTTLDYFHSFAKDLAAGGGASILSKTITAPAERVKLLLQTQKVNSSIHNNNQKAYSGPIDCAKRIYTTEGFLSFWRGNVANILRYFPNQALSLAFKDRFQVYFVGKSSASNDNFWRMVVGNLVSGGSAGALSLILTYPLDMARTRIAVDVGVSSSAGILDAGATHHLHEPHPYPRVLYKYNGIVHCLSQVYTEGSGSRGTGALQRLHSIARGIGSCYSGFSVTVMGAVVFKAAHIGGYEIIKDVFQFKRKQTKVTHKFFAAQVLTAVVGTLCYPLDTIRRRIMIRKTMGVGPDGLPELYYKGALHCLQKIVREEGVGSGLFSGLSVNLLRGVGAAFILVAYDEIKDHIK